MADPKLVVKQTIDNSAFRKGLKQSQTGVEKFSSSISKIGVAIAAAFSVGAIINFTKRSIEAAGEEEKAQTKLLVALKGRKDITNDLIEDAARLQKITVFGDETTVEAYAQLAAFVKNEDALKRLMPLVQDMATALGMDLNHAAMLVGKSVGSSTNALKRQGIEIEGAVGSSERLESAVSALSERFEGQSVAAAKTASGGVAQLANAWSDLMESFGRWVADPAMIALIRLLSGGLQKLNTIGKGSDLKLFDVNGIVNDAKLASMSIEEVNKELSKINNDALIYFENWKRSDGEQRSFWAGQYDIAKENIGIIQAFIENQKLVKDNETAIVEETEKELSIREQILERIKKDAEYQAVMNQLIQERNAQNITSEINTADGVTQLNALTKAYYDLAVAQGLAAQGTTDATSVIAENSESISYAMQSMGASIADSIAAFAQGEKTLKDTAFDIIRTIIKLIAGYLAQSVASSFAGGASVGGPAAPFTGAAAAASAASLFGSLVPALLAEGGTVPGGFPNDSYPAMLTSGETVVPAAIPLNLSGGGYDQISTKIRGEDIYVTWKKQDSKNKRYR
jgi:hypothetical protein